MLMGFFQVVRNLYQHNDIGSGVSNALTVLLDASFFLNLLDGNSITKHGRWVSTRVNYKDIYYHMPKRLDRIKLRRMLKKRYRRQIAENREDEGDK